jgi:hypothetical protein
MFMGFIDKSNEAYYIEEKSDTKESCVDQHDSNSKDEENEEKKVNSENQIKLGDKINEKRAMDQSVDSESMFDASYYYATNLDLYIAIEPCIMCAMALGKTS